jgi:hypothetical protein
VSDEQDTKACVCVCTCVCVHVCARVCVSAWCVHEHMREWDCDCVLARVYVLVFVHECFQERLPVCSDSVLCHPV